MDKYIVIDNKMRKVEKEYLKSLGYRIINIQTNKNVYDEISSHVDIFACKIKDKIVVEPSVYSYLKEEKYDLENVICGKNKASSKYPLGKLPDHSILYDSFKARTLPKGSDLNS